MILISKIESCWHGAKINGTGILSLLLILALTSASSCLGLKSHKRQPDNDAKDCAGVSCWKPPSNTCTADAYLQVYAPSGYCSGGECSYATRQEQCHSGTCDQGECVKTPCQGVFCINPPEPFCTEKNRTIWAPSGYCSGGECSYASKTSPCDFSCEFGNCTDSPCAEVFCRKPPASYCQGDKTLVVFEQEGRCNVVENRPKCLHDSQTIPCDHGCKDGRCQDDPCVGMVCDRPPARYCDGAELVLFEPRGVCDESGFCIYVEERHACIEPCVDAHCGEDDDCTWVICDTPPASYCLGASQLRVYASEGWCQTGFCSYVYSGVECTDGCEEGRCKGDPISDTDEDSDTVTDTETDTGSQVAIETIGRQAEDWDTFNTKGDSHKWYLVSTSETPNVKPDPDPNHSDSANGGAYLEALPDDDSGTYSPTSSPEIGFNVSISVAGRYYIWVRAFSADIMGNDNSIHVGVNGTWPDSGRNIQLRKYTYEWVWTSNQRDSGGDVFGVPNTIWLDIDTVGNHHVTFAMREDGFEFDEWIMTTDINFVPE